MNFQYNLPVNLIFGADKVNTVAEVCKNYGKKVLLVISGGSSKRSGLYDRIINLLSAEKLEYSVFDEIPQNPLTDTVYKGVEIAEKLKCDMVLGVGGGSVMDTAKAIAFCYVNKGDVSDYIFGLKKGNGAVPIILVPTTCGTGSEGNQIAVLTNSKTLDKKALYTMEIFPSVSIVDPKLMMTIPKHILASVGFDAFTHALEAYTSKKANPLTDCQALLAMELIGKNLPLLIENPENESAWESLSLGATLGGMVIGAAGVSAAHGMEHPVSGLRNVVHGKGLAALTPVITENFVHILPSKFAAVSRILGGKDENDCVISIKNFLKKIGLEITLKELGVTYDDVDWLTENCMKISIGNLKNAPVFLDEDKVREIYSKAI